MVNKKLMFVPQPVPDAKLRVFLFPFAGGSVSTFIPWLDHFSDDIEVVLVQPPGRGSRFVDPPFDTMSSLVSEIMANTTYICEKPFVFFGHSLGSRIAYEVCCQIEKQGLPMPLHLIASGSKAPHLPSDNKSIHGLPKQEFIEELKTLNGTPEEILNNEEIMTLLFPLLRADFKIAECYQALAKVLSLPITALSGHEDKSITDKQLQAWQELTNKDLKIYKLPGDHFFLNKQVSSITGHINKIVSQELDCIYEY